MILFNLKTPLRPPPPFFLLTHFYDDSDEVGFCQLILVPVPQTVHTCFITSTVLILLQIGVGSGGAV